MRRRDPTQGENHCEPKDCRWLKHESIKQPGGPGSRSELLRVARVKIKMGYEGR